MRYSARTSLVTGLAAITSAVGIGLIFAYPGAVAAWGALVATLSLALLACHTVLTGARKYEGRERRGWTLIGLGLSLLIPGNIILALAQFADRSDLDGLGALVNLLVLTVCGVGGFILPRDEMTGLERLRLLLESLAAGFGAATAMWWVLTAMSSEGMTAYLATVIADSALISITALLLGRRSSNGIDRALVALVGAVTMVAAGDLALAASSDLYRFGTLPDVFFLGALFAVVHMGVELHRRPAQPGERRIRPIMWRSITIVSLAPMAGLPFLVIGRTASDRVFRVGIVMVVSMLVLRQMVAFREQRDRLRRDHGGVVATVAHELRTPLTAILGALLMLEEDGLDDELRGELITTARGQAQVLTRVVGDLVSVARDTMDQIDIDPAPVAVRSLIQAAIGIADAEVHEVLCEPGDEATVMVDQSRMLQAVVNLLTNARRYGRGRIDLAVRKIEDQFRLEVHDDGPGVDERYELVIWERFERGDHHLDAAIPGSGIGLSVVRGIARAHGGEAGYRRSDRLGGSCFWITLPADRPARSLLPQGA